MQSRRRPLVPQMCLIVDTVFCSSLSSISPTLSLHFLAQLTKKTNKVNIIETTRYDGASCSLLLYDHFAPTEPKHNGVFIYERTGKQQQQQLIVWMVCIRRDSVVLHDDSVYYGLAASNPIRPTKLEIWKLGYILFLGISSSFYSFLVVSFLFWASQPRLFPCLFLKVTCSKWIHFTSALSQSKQEGETISTLFFRKSCLSSGLEKNGWIGHTVSSAMFF